jgi:hypothetical protein
MSRAESLIDALDLHRTHGVLGARRIVRVVSLQRQFRAEIGRVGSCRERCFHGDLVGSEQVEEVLVESLHPLRPALGDPVVDFVRLARVLDALLNASRAPHDLDGGHPARVLLVRQQPQ